MINLIDTHCHLNFNSYDEDREGVIENAAAANVHRIIIPGTDLSTSQEAIDLSSQYKGIYAAVGVHPNSTASMTDDDIQAIRALAANDKVIAIGEIGLDYYWDKSPHDIQHRAFEVQLDLAAQLELPVIIHNREAGHDVMDILERWATSLPSTLKQRPGVLHSFSASAETAERALAAGFYLGFTGPLTFKNADDLRRIAATVPLDRILVETDGPFLTPSPYRGKRNEPAYVSFIAERLAAIHRVDIETIAKVTTQNAEHLFRLPAQP